MGLFGHRQRTDAVYGTFENSVVLCHFLNGQLTVSEQTVIHGTARRAFSPSSPPL